MKCLLRRMLDPAEFLSEYGVRSLSKCHEREPYRLDCDGESHTVEYWPGESQNSLFGGNSNWRGPIWMPVNSLLIESLQKFHHYYGPDFKVECPTGSGRFVTLLDVANELTARLARLFLKDDTGQRPALRCHPKLATDPHFRDLVLFHEYFHGDTGRGVGADRFFGGITEMGSLYASGAAAGTLFAAGRRGAAARALSAAGATWLLLQGVKRVVNRPRPSDADPDGTRLSIARPKAMSWPSSHPAVLTTFTRVAGRELGAGAFARGALTGLDLSVAASRVYLGVHYPADVASGLLLGRAVARVWPRASHVEPEV
ncbi:MAG: phosphatase PAP2 family protein, partial [Planctomycetaceae bacterium]